MPSYLYTNLGERIELSRKPTLRRFTEFPSDDSGEFSKRILKEYSKKEDREGSRFQSGYTKNQIKNTWTN